MAVSFYGYTGTWSRSEPCRLAIGQVSVLVRKESYMYLWFPVFETRAGPLIPLVYDQEMEWRVTWYDWF